MTAIGSTYIQGITFTRKMKVVEMVRMTSEFNNVYVVKDANGKFWSTTKRGLSLSGLSLNDLRRLVSIGYLQTDDIKAWQEKQKAAQAARKLQHSRTTFVGIANEWGIDLTKKQLEKFKV